MERKSVQFSEIEDENIDKEKNENDKKNPRVEYEVAKSELKKIRKAEKVSVVMFLIFGMLAYIFIYFALKNNYFRKDDMVECVAILGITLPLIFFAVCIAFSKKENRIQRKIVEYETGYIQGESDNDIFASSIKMSYKYLDQYYLQTREQAQKGFVITVSISVFGAFLIAIGIMTMFLGKTDPSYITCGSGVITEFISAIFFYLYNRTVLSMSNYHNKLVLSHNVSIALKVADSLASEDKAKSKNLIINELLKDINMHLISSEKNTRNSDNE